jgi:hypothetical protein
MGKQCDTHGKPQKETKLANLKLHVGLAKARGTMRPTVIRNAAKIFMNLHLTIH